MREALTGGDWAAFTGRVRREQGVRGAAVFVPWLVDGVSGEERERALGAFPAPVRVLNRVFWEGSYRRLGLWGG